MNETWNPWLDVPTEQHYLLPCDRGRIEAYNYKHPDKDDVYYVHDDVLPEPFVGSTTAPVVLLGLNPGFDEKNIEEHARPEFQDQLHKNYCHGQSDFPFYFLNPQLKGGGQEFWKKKLHRLLKEFQPKELARSILCIEYFPYHSRRFRHASIKLPSQEYGFRLVQSAIDRDAVVVVMRSKRLWLEVISRMAEYRRFFALKNPRNPTLSPGNCPHNKFQLIVSAIRDYLGR